MDVFKINWNQRIKNDLFVNKLLNGDEDNRRMEWIEKDSDGNEELLFVTQNRWNYFFEYKKRNRGIMLDLEEFNYNTEFENMGPQSLYNLRYVSLI